MKCKNTKNINFDVLLKFSQYFNFNRIDINNFENILEIYDANNVLCAIVNYCFLPSLMGGLYLYIRDLYYIDRNNLDGIIKSLCDYCKNNKFAIKTILDNDKFDDDIIKALYNNNFNGKNILYYL
jgi:hypothetical protein